MNSGSSKTQAKMKPNMFKKILPKLPTRVIEINVPQLPVKRCFVCDELVHVGGVALMQTTTQVTNTQMSSKIGQLMGEKLVVVASKDDLLCRKCHALVNHVDKLESDLQLVKKALRNHLKKKYGMTDEQMREIAGLSESVNLVNDIESEEDAEPPLKLLKTVPSRYRAIKPKPSGLASLLKCSVCDFVTTQPDILNCHRAICPATISPSAEIHKCTMCDKEFITLKLLKQHKLVAHLTQWMCHFCNISFTEETDFTSHMKSHLGDHIARAKQNGHHEFKCDHEDCKESFSSMSQLKAHVGTHENIVTIKCVRCDIGFQNKREMLEHVKTHDEAPSKADESEIVQAVFDCPMCSLRFLEETPYVQHLQTHPQYQDSGNMEEVVCGDCGERQAGEDDLQVHQLTQCMGAEDSRGEGRAVADDGTLQLNSFVSAELIDEDLVMEQDADGKFSKTNSGSFKEDNGIGGVFQDKSKKTQENGNSSMVSVKIDKGSYLCGECQHVETNLDALEKHIFDHHGMYQCDACDKTFDKKGLDKHANECLWKSEGVAEASQAHLQCPHCSLVFTTRRSLYQHEATHIENLLIQCPDCDERFTRDKFLNEHRDAVHPIARCRVCKKEFHNVKQLKAHEARHMRSDKTPFKCTECDRLFQTPTGLRHHKAIHTGDFKYKCEFCDKGFVSRVRYEEHRASHTKEERYSCEICGKKFSFQATYWIHRKWHDNPTPYKCEFCDRLFKHTSLLAVHKRKHTGERPYECPHCDQTFAVGNTLKRHLMLHTGVFPYTCPVCAQGFPAKHKMALHMSKVHHHHEMLQQVRRGADKKDKKDFKMVVRGEEKDEEEKLEGNQTWIVQEKEESGQLLAIQTEEGESIPCTFLTDEMLGEMAASSNRFVSIVLDEAYDVTKTEAPTEVEVEESSIKTEVGPEDDIGENF